jgi:hypothetical protein
MLYIEAQLQTFMKIAYCKFQKETLQNIPLYLWFP